MTATPDDAASAAAEALSPKHAAATYNDYGRCVSAGFTVAGSSDGRARVTHSTPDPDLLDEDRRSDDDVAAERHRMVAQYAAALTIAGWHVEKRGPSSRRPYLLATPTA